MLTRRVFLAAATATAVTALPNRRGEAHPISLTERESRIDRARSLMRANRIDAIILAGGTSLDYFTGIRWGNSERLFAFVLPQKGNPFYVAPSFEEERLRVLMSREPRILTWNEDDDPYALVARALREAGVATGKAGIEERVPFVFSDGIRQAARGVELISATPVTAGCRSIKSATELRLMQLANNVTLQVYEATWKSLKPGMTNNDVSDLIAAGYRQTGFPGDASCQVDAWSALPHGSLQPQVIREGSIVLIDDGCIVEGYQSDITRTFVMGKASDKMKRVFDTVHKAQTAALKAARPGVECQAVDAAARKVVDDAGFGPGYTHFTHRVGHGIGMDEHEWPYLVKGNTQLIQANMTTSDEPGIYLKGEFGVRLEDDMYITPDGARWFTPQSNSGRAVREMNVPLLLVAACVVGWCLFMASVCTALMLGEDIINEVERDLPLDRRPSLIYWWNGRAVALAAYRKHATLFPNSKLRVRHNVALIAAVVSFGTFIFLCSGAFGF